MNHKLGRLRRVLRAPDRALRHSIDAPEFVSGGQVSARARLMAGTYVLFQTLRESDFTTRAASISYSFVFSLIPLLTTTLAFFTAFPGLQNEREQVSEWLFSQLLPGAVQGVQSHLEAFSRRAAAAGAVSSLVFLVVVLMVFQSVEDTFNRIWRVERGRTWGERLQALAQFFIAGAIMATLLIVIRHEAGQLEQVRLLSSKTWLQRYGLYLGSVAVAWGAFTVALRVLPNTAVRWKAALIGGIAAGTVWHVLKAAFTWYIEDIASYANIYGALGAIPAFFLWLYLSAILLLLGGYASFVAQNLNALVLMRHARRGGQARAFFAVAVAATLAKTYREGQGPVTARQISRSLGVAPYFATEALVLLSESSLVLAIPEKEEQLYLLAKPAESIRLQQLVDLVTCEELLVPGALGGSALGRRIQDVFQVARSRERNVLEQVTLADVEEQAPGAAPLAA